jgi:hypothetical protein
MSKVNISQKIAVWQPSGLSEKDVTWLIERFGSRTTLPVAVVARSSDGLPAVVKMPLVRNGEPFPTLYWLTDPILTPKITALEYEGGVRKAELFLRDTSEARAIFLDQHARYIHSRWATAAYNEQELVIAKGYERKLSKVGIGGVADFFRVKCLHLHVAHFLATQDNVIGKWVLDQVNCSGIPHLSSSGELVSTL